MQAEEIHRRLDELVAETLLRGGFASADAEQRAVGEHASSGCSLCARALVNTGAAWAELAALPPAASPTDVLRDRVVSAARSQAFPQRDGRAPSVRPPDASPLKERRVRDPSATVAHLHLTGPNEAARANEVEELSAYTRREGDPTARVLAQIEKITGCPLLFVSIIRGERVGYRVQRGLPDELQASVEMRREMTFCTHCVDAERPLVVENALREPFFRGNPAVQRHRIRAYVGVPLRTSNGIVVGTLCALDFGPRSISADVVRSLELFTLRVVAEIERPRGAAGLSALLAQPDSDIYRRPWFEELLGVELARVRAEQRPTALLSAPRQAADLVAEDNVVGELDESTVGILISGAAEARAEEKRAALERALSQQEAKRDAPRPVRLAMGEAGLRAADWIARVLSPGV